MYTRKYRPHKLLRNTGRIIQPQF